MPDAWATEQPTFTWLSRYRSVRSSFARTEPESGRQGLVRCFDSMSGLLWFSKKTFFEVFKTFQIFSFRGVFRWFLKEKAPFLFSGLGVFYPRLFPTVLDAGGNKLTDEGLQEILALLKRESPGLRPGSSGRLEAAEGWLVS